MKKRMNLKRTGKMVLIAPDTHSASEVSASIARRYPQYQSMDVRHIIDEAAPQVLLIREDDYDEIKRTGEWPQTAEQGVTPLDVEILDNPDNSDAYLLSFGLNSLEREKRAAFEDELFAYIEERWNGETPEARSIISHRISVDRITALESVLEYPHITLDEATNEIVVPMLVGHAIEEFVGRERVRGLLPDAFRTKMKMDMKKKSTAKKRRSFKRKGAAESGEGH